MAENITDLTGRVAVVIGGTSGLGRAIAVGLARAGAKTVPAGRRGELVREVCDEITRNEGKAFAQTADVAERDSVNALRDAVVERFGAVDILVNAAGRLEEVDTVRFSELDVDAASGLLEVDVIGTMRMCHAARPIMLDCGAGAIVNFSSR